MSFDTLKNYIKGRLEGLGYIESKSPFDFADAPDTEYNNCFILTPLEGSVDPDGANLNICLYDNQTWQVSIAFSKSAHNDVINRDDMYRSVEAIIKDLDNPSNYSSTVELMEYQEWEVEEFESYYNLRIRFRVRDKYIY